VAESGMQTDECTSRRNVTGEWAASEAWLKATPVIMYVKIEYGDDVTGQEQLPRDEDRARGTVG